MLLPWRTGHSLFRGYLSPMAMEGVVYNPHTVVAVKNYSLYKIVFIAPLSTKPNLPFVWKKKRNVCSLTKLLFWVRVFFLLQRPWIAQPSLIFISCRRHRNEVDICLEWVAIQSKNDITIIFYAALLTEVDVWWNFDRMISLLYLQLRERHTVSLSQNIYQFAL